MCKAVEDYTLKTQVLTLIEFLKDEGASDDEIIKKIMDKLHVTEKYVTSLMAA